MAVGGRNASGQDDGGVDGSIVAETGIESHRESYRSGPPDDALPRPWTV